MDALRRFGAILLADLRERTRTPRFWALLAAMVVASWYCFPAPEKQYLVLAVDEGLRGAYSSAWIGLALAMVYSLLLGLGGFYVVRGTLDAVGVAGRMQGRSKYGAKRPKKA